MRMIVIAVFLACALSLPTWAVPYVSATYEPVDSVYLLRFAVHMENPSYGQSDGWGLLAAGFTDLVAPEGWEAGTDYGATLWDAHFPQYYIEPGDSLHGFSAVSQVLPASMNYFIRAIGEGPGSYYGTLTPVPVPEPSSLLALGSGLLGVGIPWLRRRVRTRA